MCGHGHEQNFKYPYPWDNKIIQMPYPWAKVINQIPALCPASPCQLDIDRCISAEQLKTFQLKMSLICMKMKTRLQTEPHGNAEIPFFTCNSVTIWTGLEPVWNGGLCGEISEKVIWKDPLQWPRLPATIPDKKVGTTSKLSPLPTYNVDNRVIFSLFVGRNAIFSNID